MNTEYPSGMSSKQKSLLWQKNLYSREEIDTCIEKNVNIYLNRKFVTSQVASPGGLAELGAGHVICEGLAPAVDSVRLEGDDIHVTAPSAGIKKIERRDDFIVGPDEIFYVIDGIVSELWKKTGGAHCSVLISGGSPVARFSDIGRHNTVDKVVGHAALNGIDPAGCILGCTGRQPEAMVKKAANAGIPIVISKAATTDRGIEKAMETGITLICRVRDGRFVVFSGEKRIRR